MRPVRLRRLLAGLPVLVVCGAAHAEPSFMGLGDLPGAAPHSFGFSVSADGSVAAGFGNSEGGNEAFVWDAAHGMQGLGDLPGGFDMSRAAAVSADGSTVVGTGNFGLDPEAFLWDAANGLRALEGELPTDAVASLASDVSADGTVVVGKLELFVNGHGQQEAFVWDAVGGYQGLGDLAGGGPSSEGNGISGDGSIIVGWSSSTSGTEAFRWDESNGMVGLGDLVGGTFFSSAQSISDDGSSIVGESRSAAGTEAFRWDAAHGMQGLGDLPGGDFRSIAWDVSADGSTVVGTSTSDAGSEAFVWTADWGMISLQGLLTDLGLDLTGWHLTTASSVSADGRTIVGSGEHPDGFNEAFIAVIPEPDTALLLGLGMAWLGRRGRNSPAARLV